MPSRKKPRKSSRVDYGGDAIEIGFNVTYLMDVLSQHQPGHGEDRAAGQQCQRLFTVPEQPGFKYVVMPMRI
jgi:DNA polymerase-3 subunit beta